VTDILNSILREIVALAGSDNGNQQAAGIGSIAVLCVISLLVFPALTLILYASKKESNETLGIRITIALVQLFAACFYFYGDNINYIMRRYGDKLGCDDQCVTNNRIAAVIALGIGVIMLHLFPPVVLKSFNMVKWEDHRSSWYSSLDVIAVYMNINVIYTAFAIMTQTDTFCSHTDLAFSTSGIVICILAGLAIMIIECLCSICNKADPKFIGACVPLAIGFILYLLADNEQPMDCAFDCDAFAANQSCDARTNSGLRLGFMLATLIIVVVVVGLLSVHHNYDETDRKQNNTMHQSTVNFRKAPKVSNVEEQAYTFLWACM
jgi:hypothetical protein